MTAEEARSRRRRFAAVAAVSSVLLFGLGVAPAMAHGERTQSPRLRTMTATFLDVRYSPDPDGPQRDLPVDVGQHLRVSGTLVLARDWPMELGPVGIGYLGMNMPGPVMMISDKKINDTFVPGSVRFRAGSSYTFEIELVGRRPGRWHVHPRLDLKGQGPLVGPGRWIRVHDRGTAFRNRTLLASGKEIELEHYGLSTVLSWTFLWFGLAAGFCGLWLRKGILSRFVALRRGAAGDDLVVGRDRRVAAALGALSVVLIVGAPVYAGTRWRSIPLQVYRDTVPDRPSPPELAAVGSTEARYDTRARSLAVSVELASRAATNVAIERLVMGPLSFAAPGFVGPSDTAPLGVAPNAALAPGETRRLTLTLNGAPLEAERLTTTNLPIDRIGGLLVLRDSDGRRSWTTVSFDLVKDVY